MLTTWKRTRSSLEYASPVTTGRGKSESAKKKKNGSKKAPSAEPTAAAHLPQGVLGAQFVRPRASVRGGKKRRKIDASSSSSPTEADPILCLASPHRVAFVVAGGGGDPTECPSRAYVARPGAASRLSLRDPRRRAADGAFAGMVTPGARYDPASNLVYAIRNGGAEVTVWTAAPSSELAGPDEEVRGAAINGTKDCFIARSPKNAGKSPKNAGKSPKNASKSPKSAGWKRKPPQEDGLSSDAIFSQRLSIPGGRRAATLTPFSAAAAVGAAGCCDDGSVWAAVRFRSKGGWGEFRLVVVKGTSTDGTAKSAAKSNGRRKSSAKSGWELLDSRVTGTVDRGEDGASVLLSIQSVVLSKDKTAQIAFRNHQVLISCGESGAKHLAASTEKFERQDILKLESPETDVAIEMDTSSDSLSIVHKAKEGGWTFTSVDLSRSHGVCTYSTRTFPLPSDGAAGDAQTVFSFGGVGHNLVAVLTKSPGAGRPGTSAMTLRIVDPRRRAELSCLRWIEGDDDAPDEILCGKLCRAMITNGADGSIALLASPKEGGGVLDVILSKLASSAAARSAPTTSGSASLASALRSAATSVPRPAESKNDTRQGDGLNIDLASHTWVDKNCALRSPVDDAVDEACKLLATSREDLIRLAAAGGEKAADRLITNGKRREGPQKPISWREVYRAGCALIEGAGEGEPRRPKSPINGARGWAHPLAASKTAGADGLPKRFVEAAFKESLAVLLSLRKEAATLTRVQKWFWKMIREVTSTLVDVLRTNLISAREDYGVGSLCRGNVLLSILQAHPSPILFGAGDEIAGRLHIIDAALGHVGDIPEAVLVSILSFVLRKVQVEDVVAYYSTVSAISQKGARLSSQYTQATETTEAGEDDRSRIGTVLLSEAVLDFTSRIVTYSNCNHSFLTKAMLDTIDAGGELEALLLTLARLLKSGSARKLRKDDDSHPDQIGLTSGAVRWISALTDAHGNAIRDMAGGGGPVVDRIRGAVRAATAQSELAIEVREMSELAAVHSGAVDAARRSSASNARRTDAEIAPYSVERLAF